MTKRRNKMPIDINDIRYYEFLEKVTNYYLHNLENYPEEKPTIDGAFREVLLELSRELTNNE
tara:strand:+ start:540 stop:725 length:186 start_codon:yes stop_codon:yes gene_type:complete